MDKRLPLVKDLDESRIYRIKDGRHVRIEVDDFFEQVQAFDEKDGEIGRFKFLEIEFDEIPQQEDTFKFIWGYLDSIDDSYKRQGIGRQMLLDFKWLSGAKIVASQNDGMRHNDGSHLTDDAPPFIAQMREENIIE